MREKLLQCYDFQNLFEKERDINGIHRIICTTTKESKAVEPDEVLIELLKTY